MGEIDKTESEEESDKRKESVNYFMVLSNEVTNSNWKLDNAIGQFDIPSYDELSQAFMGYIMIWHLYA